MNNRRGFTLLELLLSMALTAALVVLASNIYQTVQKVGNKTLNINRDWGVENFVRLQVEAFDAALNSKYLAVDFKPDALTFISRNSAQFGHSQRPVLATYRYDASQQSMIYSELTLPPWWDGRDALYAQQMDSWKSGGYRQGFYQGVMLSGVDTARFEIWDFKSKQWSTQWNDKKILPSIIRLTTTQSGRNQYWVVGAGALSLSSVSGS